MEGMPDRKYLLDRLGAAVVATDADGIIVYLNRAGEDLFAKYGPPESLLGRNLADCHKPETMIRIKEMYDSFKNGDRRPRFYVRENEKGKRTVVQVPVYDGDELEGVMEFILSGAP